MHIGPLGLPEIIIILVVVLVIFGPKNLPKLGKAVGRTFKNLREGMDSGKDDEEEPAKAPAKDETAQAAEPEVEDAAGTEKKN